MLKLDPSISNQSKGSLEVVVLTYNEELNLPHALRSVCGWADEVLVFDSFSNDRTLEIARDYGCKVIQNVFEDYGKQRNAALAIPSACEWALFLDADEWLSEELKVEIKDTLQSNSSHNGYYLKWRLIWMGKWIRRGYYPTWILRLFRRGAAHCEARSVNEHMVVTGTTGQLKFDIFHQDRKDLSDWVVKHNRYATREALELVRIEAEPAGHQLDARFFGSQAQRKRWLRHRVWNHLPVLIRPFLYFFYRYILRGGFLDGRAGFSYHFLQGLWFPVLIDLKYLEIKREDRG